MITLSSHVVPAAGLDATTREAMYRLLDRHYANVTPEGFAADLAEKDWVILLRAGASLAGFSTQMRLETRFEGEPIDAVFSGDTIIDPAHWGSTELQAAFTGLLHSLRRERPERRLFWFLISKGFRTYRILPLYFREFWPRHAQVTPDWHRRFLDHLARAKFPQAWDPDAGVLRFNGRSQYLRPALAGIPEEKAALNPHIGFFARANPGHDRGDELACLAEFTEANLTPLVRKRLRGRAPGAAQAG